MSYRLLLDENVEFEVLDRLEKAGHDVEHVELSPRLGKGATDEALASYSIETDRTIVTYDDDLVREIPADRYRAVLFFEDQTLSAEEVAGVVHAMSLVYPHEAVWGIQKTGREWL